MWRDLQHGVNVGFIDYCGMQQVADSSMAYDYEANYLVAHGSLYVNVNVNVNEKFI